MKRFLVTLGTVYLQGKIIFIVQLRKHIYPLPRESNFVSHTNIRCAESGLE